MDHDIGVRVNILRGDVAVAYTPSLDDNPDDFEWDVYPAGDIYTTTRNQYIWMKPVDPNSTVSASAEIMYGVPT